MPRGRCGQVPMPGLEGDTSGGGPTTSKRGPAMALPCFLHETGRRCFGCGFPRRVSAALRLQDPRPSPLGRRIDRQQGPPPARSTGRRTVSARAPAQAAGGPDSSADADDNYGIVCVSDFVPYVGDDGGFDVSGHVWMRSIPDGPQEITLRLKGVDPRCSGGPGDAPGSCGVRVHEGSSCGAGTGGSLYHQSRASHGPRASRPSQHLGALLRRHGPTRHPSAHWRSMCTVHLEVPQGRQGWWSWSRRRGLSEVCLRSV